MPATGLDSLAQAEQPEAAARPFARLHRHEIETDTFVTDLELHAATQPPESNARPPHLGVFEHIKEKLTGGAKHGNTQLSIFDIDPLRRRDLHAQPMLFLIPGREPTQSRSKAERLENRRT